MPHLRSTFFALVLIPVAIGCAQSIRIDVNRGVGEAASNITDIGVARTIVEEVARDFDFDRHPDEGWYLQGSRTRDRAGLEYVSAYFHSGSQEYGRIDLFLAYSREDRHLVVIISDMDAYGRSDFIESLQNAVVAALAKKFPTARIEVDSSRGISPLGP